MANPTPLPTKVAEELRAEMARQRKTITHMADALGLDRKATKLRYDGDKSMTLTEVETLASWLGVSIEDLLLGPVLAVAS